MTVGTATQLSMGALTLRYAAFAAVATGVNVGTQVVSLAAYAGPLALGVAMALGTGTGLVTKYLLDKHFIFFDTDNSVRGHSVKFTLYSLMGVATTAIFWGTELLFHTLLAGKHMKYMGAVLGLAIGYVTKYQLDRRFVFRAGRA
jgi:putative flippase GtrA